VTDETRRRLDLARRIAPAYVRNVKIKAIIVHGSVARGWADRYSDLEMRAFWKGAPSDAERGKTIQLAGGKLQRLYPYEAENIDWTDEFTLDDIKVDLSHSRLADIDRCMTDVIHRFDPVLLKQQIVAQIRYGIPLHGIARLASWKAQAARYPGWPHFADAPSASRLDPFVEGEDVLGAGRLARAARNIGVRPSRDPDRIVCTESDLRARCRTEMD